MLQVLLTIDVDTFPINKDWKSDNLARDIRRDVYAEVDGRAVGLTYQLETLARYGLHANFMVESLFSAVPEVGLDPLRTIVGAVRQGEHDIHLHPHTEWLPHAPALGLRYRTHLLRDYPLAEQERIIWHARAQLEAAGAPTPVAFRAGGFAANADTFLALERCGVRFDTSFNHCYGSSARHLPRPEHFGHATRFGQVLELPVSVFEDHPWHLRPAQLCACSYTEMTHALDMAERSGWQFFTIVSHSFEMLTHRWHPTRHAVIRETVVHRFERLCRFLAENQHRFTTTLISRLEPTTPTRPIPGIQGKLTNTGARVLSQAYTRFQAR